MPPVSSRRVDRVAQDTVASAARGSGATGGTKRSSAKLHSKVLGLTGEELVRNKKQLAREKAKKTQLETIAKQVGKLTIMDRLAGVSYETILENRQRIAGEEIDADQLDEFNDWFEEHREELSEGYGHWVPWWRHSDEVHESYIRRHYGKRLPKKWREDD